MKTFYTTTNSKKTIYGNKLKAKIGPKMCFFCFIRLPIYKSFQPLSKTLKISKTTLININ